MPTTDPRPAPSTGGRERAAPQPRANALNIPLYKGLAEWESRTAPDRGHNLRDPVQRYPPGAVTARAGPPRRKDDPRTVSMILLESGHYYQVRISPHPQECHWNLEAVDSMLLARAALLNGPSPLPRNQSPDPLTAVVSGNTGSWQPGHVLYCLWRWAQRCWPHTRDLTVTWRFHLDSLQQLGATPQRERAAETPATTNLCHVFAIYQIRALTMGGQLQPTIRTETEAQAAHAALMHEILSALRSALVRRIGNPPGPYTTASRNEENAPMNTRDGIIGIAAPRPTRYMRALPDATSRRQWKGTIPTGRLSGNQRGTAADMRRHTAAHTRHEPQSGHLTDGETTRQP